LYCHCWCGAGYWAEDWTRVDPHYGTEADLQQLLLTAKTKGELLLLQLLKGILRFDVSHAGQPDMRLLIVACSVQLLVC
jgi:hypothetical protein